jgi:tetratricopeptide (TPR) repeat protein
MARVPLEVKQNDLLWFQLDYLGQDLRAHGYRQAAQAVFERGIRWTHAVIKTRSPAEQRELRLGLAALLYDAERWDDAGQVLKALAGETPDDIGVRARLGAVAAHRGDRPEVARIDRWLAKRKDLYLHGEPTFERARLAAILGERDRALELYRQALDQAYAFNQGGYGIFHPDPDFESLRSYPLFQELTRPKD